MKKISYLLACFIGSMTMAQIPSGYYDGTENLTGFALKTKLSEIIKSGHRDRGYNGLWTVYKTSDIDHYYENDGSILDMYSENPKGRDPYTYRPGRNQCGSYSGEGSCYNREHLIPQSFFGKKSPMVADAHFITPTDGKVNGMRSDYPFGEVSSPRWTSKNGSKLGTNTTKGYRGTVFEPIDEFKGDIARMVLYFVTRYEKEAKSLSFKSGDMLSPNTKAGLQDWQLQVLLKWHQQDPVSKRERDRNKAIYDFQKNRNPYIDHPEYVQKIWGDSKLSTADLIPEAKNQLKVYPNPVKNGIIHLKNLKNAKKVEIYNLSGQKVSTLPAKSTLNLRHLPKGGYILKVQNQSIKFIIE